jgi:dTDP-4-amino-4,6-dideoxy-D-galactose acyltransferase
VNVTEGNGYILKSLQWDTDFFGVKCLRVYINEELTDKQYVALQKDIEDYNFIVLDNVIGSSKNNQLLCQLNNCFLVDVPIVYCFKLVNRFDKVKDLCVKNNLDYNQKILRIGQNAFKLGRFYNDKNISEEKASRLYVSWLKSAFNRDDKFFVVDKESNGFILFSETSDKKGLDIELIATVEVARAKGIAKQMLIALKSYAVNSGYKYITVVTQANNVAAVNLYSGQGFRLDKCMYTFHCWNLMDID